MHPHLGLATVDIEEDAGHVEGRIALEVEQDVKTIYLRGDANRALPTSTDGPLPGTLEQTLGIDLTKRRQERLECLAVQTR